MQSMKICPQLLVGTLLFLTGCTRYSAYLADMGSRCDGVMVDDSTIYRAGSKMYIKGQKVEYRNLTIPIWAPKGPNSSISKIKGSEGEIVYREIKKAPRDYPDSHTLAKNTSWISAPPPLTASKKQHRLNYIHYTGECRTDLNALWAYPAATLAFVVVDVPCTIGIWCFAAASIPVLFIHEQLKD